MDNEALRQIFRNLRERITKDVIPDYAAEELQEKKIITLDDYCTLKDIQDPKDRCSELLLIVDQSSHPQSFIILREALRDSYPEIVREIDEQLQEPAAAQPQQALQSHSADGTFVHSA